MTTQEAIEVLDKCHSGYTQEKVQTAYNMAKEALRAQAEKERRYVVKEEIGGTWLVRNSISNVCVAAYIHTEAAAQAIADIYEGMDNE